MTQTPLPAEPLSYEQLVAADADTRAIRALAIVGLIVGSSRIGSAFLYAWLYGFLGLPRPQPYQSLNMGTIWNAFEVAELLEALVAGVLLAVGAAGLFRGRLWGRNLVLRIELIHLGLRFLSAPAQAIVNGPSYYRSGPGFLLSEALGILMGLINITAFSLIAILILWRRPRNQSLGENS
jgi:hypothetical protein